MRRMKEITERMNVIFIVNTRREKIMARVVIMKRDTITGDHKGRNGDEDLEDYYYYYNDYRDGKKGFTTGTVVDGTLVRFLLFFLLFYRSCYVARDLYILSRERR